MAKFNEDVLNGLISNIITGCDEYDAAYKKLTGLIDEVQNGTFAGDVATEFQRVYNDNKGTFDQITNDIEEKGSTIKQKTQAGVQLAEDLKSDIARGY